MMSGNEEIKLREIRMGEFCAEGEIPIDSDGKRYCVRKEDVGLPRFLYLEGRRMAIRKIEVRTEPR